MSNFNQTQYINDWQKENLERIAFTVPKGQRAKIKEYALKKGYSSTNAYLQALVYEDMRNKNTDN